MGYSFVISTSIKQLKGLELILSVSFAFGSCCCEAHHVIKGEDFTRVNTEASPQAANKARLDFDKNI